MSENMTTVRSSRISGLSHNEPPVRGLLEEIGNSVSHGIGALLGIAALVLMLIRSRDPRMAAAAGIYGSCLIILFLNSCLYHAWRTGSTVKRLWRRFDYCSIYLLIGGSFAPLLLVYLRTGPAMIMFIVQWCLIAAGVTFIGVFGPGRFRRLHVALYLLIGWSALVFIPSMLRSTGLFAMILGGGIAYTLGVIPYSRRKRGAHFLWHLFVLLGAILQWFGIYIYVYAK